MNASKENARKANRFLDQLVSGEPIPELGREERETFIRQFLLAAERKLPSEEAFSRQKQRTKR